jgi:hypothetical protein
VHIVPQAGNCGKETRAKQQEKTDPAGEQQNPFHHAGSELIMGTEQENAALPYGRTLNSCSQ